MIDLKALKKARADKAARGVAANAEYNTLAAVATRTAEQDASMAALDAELTGLEAECSDLNGKILAEERVIARNAVFSPAVPGSPERAQPALRQPFGGSARTDEPNPATTGGFRAMAEFCNAVVLANSGNGVDERLGALVTPQGGLSATAPATYQSTGGAGGEGFLVPPDYAKKVWDFSTQEVDLLGMLTPEPTTSNAVGVPKDETTPWGAAGVRAAWAGQAQQLQPSKAQLTGALMNLHKLYAFVAVTDEVLADAPMLNDRITRQAGRAIGWTASDAIMWGDGVGQPMGFMLSKALIVVAADPNQPKNTLSLVNVANMAARILRSGGSPMFLANQDVLPQLITMTQGNIPAYSPNSQPLSASPYAGALLGFPIKFTEHSQTLGQTGDIVCVDLDGYYAATKVGGGIEFASSMHLYFDMGMTAFRWTFRFAGQPYLSAPVVPAHGTNTKSHFVSLAKRA